MFFLFPNKLSMFMIYQLLIKFSLTNLTYAKCSKLHINYKKVKINLYISIIYIL